MTDTVTPPTIMVKRGPVTRNELRTQLHAEVMVAGEARRARWEAEQALVEARLELLDADIAVRDMAAEWAKSVTRASAQKRARTWMARRGRYAALVAAAFIARADS